MTNMTRDGITTTTAIGQEQYEKFYRKIRGKKTAFIAYDYRHTDGELFSCVKKNTGIMPSRARQVDRKEGRIKP